MYVREKLENTERQNAALLYKILFVALFISLAVLYRVTTSDEVHTAGFSLFLLLGILVAASVVMLKEPRGQPFCAFSIAAILWVLGFVFRGIVLSTSGGGLDRFWGAPEEHLVEAAVLCILGFLFFFLGYRSRIGPMVASWIPYVAFPNWEKMPHGKLLFKLYLFYAIGWGGRVLLFSIGVFHRQQELSADVTFRSWANMIAQMSIFSVWALMAIKNEKGHRFVSFIPLVVIEFLYGLIEGGRTTMVQTLVIYLFTRSLYGRRPVKWINILLVLTISFISIFPLLSMIRNSYYRATDEEGKQGVDTAIRAISRWDDTYSTGGLSVLQEGIFRRFAYIDPLLVVLDRVPSLYPFQHGDTFISQSLYTPIPRLFWKDKPIHDTGRRWAIMFGDDPSEAAIGTHGHIGIVAEAFFNFGYWGLVLLFFTGAWVRMHWTRYTTYKSVDPASALRIPYLWGISSPVIPMVVVCAGFWRSFFDMYFFTVLMFGIPKIVRHDSGYLRLKD